MADNRRDDLFQIINDDFALKDIVPGEAAPLVLAYIGDAVYEIIIRQMVVSKGNRAVEKLHKKAITLVNAGTQADIIEVLLPLLTPEEESIYKRGKNAKSGTSSKNASLKDYHKATGFEALIGYLYLKNEMNRISELIKKAFELLNLLDF